MLALCLWEGNPPTLMLWIDRFRYRFTAITFRAHNRQFNATLLPFQCTFSREIRDRENFREYDTENLPELLNCPV